MNNLLFKYISLPGLVLISCSSIASAANPWPGEKGAYGTTYFSQQQQTKGGPVSVSFTCGGQTAPMITIMLGAGNTNPRASVPTFMRFRAPSESGNINFLTDITAGKFFMRPQTGSDNRTLALNLAKGGMFEFQLSLIGFLENPFIFKIDTSGLRASIMSNKSCARQFNL